MNDQLLFLTENDIRSNIYNSYSLGIFPDYKKIALLLLNIETMIKLKDAPIFYLKEK